MPPPPKRKWPNRPRGGGGGGGANGSAPGTPTTPRSTVAQLPKRPKIEEAAPKADGVDVKQMYSTSAGHAEAKPFSELSGVLDKSLLDGLDKMGFE
jgi:ATP-dependent RNA helicase MSS116